MRDVNRSLSHPGLPLVIPAHFGVEKGKRPELMRSNPWETTTLAEVYREFCSDFDASTPPAIEQFLLLLDAYRDGDVHKFNSDVPRYQTFLAKYQAAENCRWPASNLKRGTTGPEPVQSVFVSVCVRIRPGGVRSGCRCRRCSCDSAFGVTLIIFAAHTLRLGVADLHLRPAAGDESVFVGRVHRLGGGGCWA